MAIRARLRDVLMFAAGVVATGILAAVLFWTPGQVAARSCPFEHLTPSLVEGGKWAEDGLKLRYKIPDCFVNDEGYRIGGVDKVDDHHISILYRK